MIRNKASRFCKPSIITHMALVVCIVLMLAKLTTMQEASFLYEKFPDDFEWGVATSAYQIEGGANLDGKGSSIWDVYSHQPHHINDSSNGDIACDSYHKYKTDVQMIKGLHVSTYRFSISWTRIMSDGTLGTLNQAGIRYYNSLIDELLANGIQPLVTLYHWDLPQAIEERHGGWLGREVVDLFGDYADVCFRSFGDRVKKWITLNEPHVVAVQGYEGGSMAPGMEQTGTGGYTASYYMLKAHAKAYHIYNDKYRRTQRGEISITLNCDWGEPANRSKAEDLAASDRFLQWYVGIYAHPIHHGDWPAVIKETVGAKSAAEGLNKSRLPAFTREEIAYIKGTSDFFGLNTYTTRIVTKSRRPSQKAGYIRDAEVDMSVSPDWPKTGSDWLYVVPQGIRKLLNWLKNEYPKYREILITENGMSDGLRDYKNHICDSDRIYFFENYINNVLKAIRYDGVNIVGYTAWSLMDNFEWSRGYTERFGIHYVNFTDPERPRIPKSSSIYLRHLFSSNGFPSSAILDAWKKEAKDYCDAKTAEMITSRDWKVKLSESEGK